MSVISSQRWRRALAPPPMPLRRCLRLGIQQPVEQALGELPRPDDRDLRERCQSRLQYPVLTVVGWLLIDDAAVLGHQVQHELNAATAHLDDLSD